MRQQKIHNLQLEVVDFVCVGENINKWRLICRRIDGYSRYEFHVNVKANPDFENTALEVTYPFEGTIRLRSVIEVNARVRVANKQYAYLYRPQWEDKNKVGPITTQQEHGENLEALSAELEKLGDTLLELSGYSEEIPSECFPS